jgi:outer membrane protein assembly factor BamB
MLASLKRAGAVSLMAMLAGAAFAAPTLQLNRASGPPTSQVLVSGSGFPARQTLTLYFDSTQAGQTMTDASGSFAEVTIHVPADALPGNYHHVRAVGPSGAKLQVGFRVQTNWADFGFAPAGGRFNPVENVLNPGNLGQVAKLFEYQAGFYYFASLVVSDGTVYFNDSDTVYAINAHTGELRWSFTGVGFHLYGTPAVSNGTVYTCSDSQYVYALDAGTGKLKWKHRAGYPGVASPVVVNGVVYVSWATSIYALDANTGSRIWQYTNHYDIYSAAAVADGTVYLTHYSENDSYLYALNVTDGSLIWKYDTVFYGNGFGSPAVSHGMVYLAAIDNVYAFNATTGSIVWQYSPSLTLGSVAVANGMVYVGGGTIFALDAKTGTLIWSNNTVFENQNSPAVANGVLYVASTNDDTIYGLDANSGDVIWSYNNGGTEPYTPVIADGVIYAGEFTGVLAFALPRSNGKR